MSDFNTVPAAVHRLELVGRERLVVSGVEDVDRFDETGIVMSTTAGTLVVTGEDLHIGKLSLDGGAGRAAAGRTAPLRTAPAGWTVQRP